MNQLAITRDRGSDIAEAQPRFPLLEEQTSPEATLPRQLIRRIARFAYLLEADAPDIVLRNERRLISAAISELVAEATTGPHLDHARPADVSSHPGERIYDARTSVDASAPCAASAA